MSARRRRRTRTWFALVLLVGVAIGVAVALKWNAFLDAHRVDEFAVRFVTSSGFGGVATIVAAFVAIFGVRRQIAHAAKASRRDRRRQTQESQDAEWWRSFEWAASKAFPGIDGSNPPLSDELSYNVARGLRDRARTVGQEETCDALVEQIASRRAFAGDPVIPTPSMYSPTATEAALNSYLAASTSSTSPTSLPAAEGRLFELRVRVAVDKLVSDGVIDSAAFQEGLNSSPEQPVSKADVVLRKGDREFVMELKRVRAPTPSVLRRMVESVVGIAAGRPALLLVSSATPLQQLAETGAVETPPNIVVRVTYNAFGAGNEKVIDLIQKWLATA